MENNRSIIPKSYGIISVIALLWNLMGLITFFQFVFISEESFQELTQPEQQLYDGFPLWTLIAFGIAVFAGTLGSVGLGMRKKWTIYGFIISLMAIIPQMTYTLFYSNHLEVYGKGSEIMPIVVVVIGILLLVYSLFANKKGWLR